MVVINYLFSLQSFWMLEIETKVTNICVQVRLEMEIKNLVVKVFLNVVELQHF